MSQRRQETRRKGRAPRRRRRVGLKTISWEPYPTQLRTPLNSIMLWSAALLRNPADWPGRAPGGRGYRAGGHGSGAIDEDLLDISRIEADGCGSMCSTVDLAEVVKAEVESMRIAAEAKAITLQEIIDSSRRRCRRRSGAAPAGDLEPGFQCRQVHADRAAKFRSA